MPKPEREFFPTDSIAWQPVEGSAPGLYERLLAEDDNSGVSSRMLRFDPGTDTSSDGVLAHAFWEEVYILEGSIHDLTLDRTFTMGMYACRPPGMRHGPWRSSNGCLTFEVRYPAGGAEE